MEIGAKISRFESANKITIQVDFSNDYYNALDDNVEQMLITTMNVAGGVIFGEEYDIGLNGEYAQNIQIEGADGIFELNKDGLLSVIGIGQGHVKFTNSETGKVLYDSYYAVHNAILCTYVKEELISQNIISHTSDIVTNDMLQNVKDISLIGELINDPTISNSLKLLSNLEVIDLSNNGIEDASFLKPLTHLKKVNLSKNKLTDISTIVDNQNLEELNLSDNQINNINKIQFMQKIKYLNLTNNNLTDISPLSSSYGLESVFLNGNKITNFKDSISGLSALTELGIGDCGIAFVDIVSLKYLSNLTYLDISGTNPNLNTVCNFTKLETLILKDCKLYDKDLTKFNNLTNIQTLDISHNDLLSSVYNNALNSNSLTKLTELRIGGNAFIDIPNLEGFTSLKTLDLTNSYNLLNLSSIADLPIETLILDECNSLSTTDYLSELQTLTNLKNLSIVSGFNYMTKDLYEGLMAKVNDGELKLKFIEGEYLDDKTISDYEKSVFFSLQEFLSYCDHDSVDTTKHTVGQMGQSRQIVLSLINEESVSIKLDIDSSLFKLDIYGDKNKTYDIKFNILDRKQSSFTLELHNMNISNNINHIIINAAVESKLNIYTYGVCSIKNGGSFYYPWAPIYVYDLVIQNKDLSENSSFVIQGAVGYNGYNAIVAANKVEWRHGENGYTGGVAIYCNSISINSGKISVFGGNGGNGGNGAYSTKDIHYDIDFFTGGNGGHGGNGGDAIQYKTSYRIDDFTNIKGGTCGNGGFGAEGKHGASNGANGNPGVAGQAIRQVS